MKKLLLEDPKKGIQSAINNGSWVHNTHISALGFDTMTIATGQGSKIPTYGLAKLKEDKEIDVGEQIEKVLKNQRLFMESEADRLVADCKKRRIPGFKHEMLEKGDLVQVRLENNKTWKGPYKVEDPWDGLIVAVDVDGEVRDVGRMRVVKW